jgi:hypothetical protein
MALTTVYYSGTLKEYLKIQSDSLVTVTDSPPEKFEVLVKCHPNMSDLTPNDDGSYSVTWGTLHKYPTESKIDNG